MACLETPRRRAASACETQSSGDRPSGKWVDIVNLVCYFDGRYSVRMLTRVPAAGHNLLNCVRVFL